MKKIIGILFRIIVAVAVFFISVMLVNRFNNRNYDSMAIEMQDAELPVAYIIYEDRYINCMHGYTSEVDTALLRESITPVDDSGHVEIALYDAALYATACSYEIRSIAGDSLIENGELTSSEKRDGYAVYDINIRMDIKKNMEYMLVFKVQDADGNIAAYYTRIVINDDYHAPKLLDFAESFNRASYDFDVSEEDSVISGYKKSFMDSEGIRHDTEDTLSHVTLSSSYDMITWNGLEPVKVGSLIPVIKEIDINYAVIELDYIAESIDGEDVISYYKVKEYYRISYSDGDIILMNFDRYVDEFFDRTEISTDKNAYQIGITSDMDIEYRYSENNKMLSFVRQGQLWLYDYSAARISLVFGFWLDDIENTRNTYDNHDINIISMDDDGNIIFAVYGYMNRGVHEGKLGICLYKYTKSTEEITELIFVENNVPYSVMKDELGRLTYYDGTTFYFMLGGVVNAIDVENKKLSHYVDGVSMDNVYVSDNMELMAYPNSDNLQETTELYLVNFASGNTYTITAGQGECLKGFGFISSDFIYGKSDLSDKIYEDADSDGLIPAHTICIVNSDNEIIKEYTKSGYYVSDVSIEKDMIYLERVAFYGTTYRADNVEDDFITFKQDDENPGIVLSEMADSRGITKAYLVFPSNVYISYQPKLIISANKDNAPNNMVIDIANDNAYYMVYDNLGLSKVFDEAGEAILYAEEVSGIVVSRSGEIVYRKSDSLEYNTIASKVLHYSSGTTEASLKDCIYMTLVYEGQTPEYDEITPYLAYDRGVVTALSELGKYPGADISGLSLSMLLKYVSEGIPVISRISDGRYVMVVSYNSTHVRYYDPVLGEEVKVTRGEYENAMALWNNEAYSYVLE